ncbi:MULTISPECIES: LD-carboxypeptidase [Klebsiella pneumoniae complex]|uniref:LD-carboxypeptidase n=1 Tax=Klebsiella pneumoniae complex TaxID=3390273 RepID=UPI0035B63F52
MQERDEELNTLIRNPDVRCIMTTIDGSNSHSLLPYLDYQALIQAPKIIIDYSLVIFYGPALVASFGECPPLVDETYHSYCEVLMQSHTGPYYTLQKNGQMSALIGTLVNPLEIKTFMKTNVDSRERAESKAGL